MTLSTKIGIDEPSWIEKNVTGYVKFKRYLSLLQIWPVIPIIFISILV